MRTNLRRFFVLGVVLVVAATVGTAAGWAGPGDPFNSVTDTSHRISALEAQLGKVQASGHWPAAGTMAAAATCGFGPVSRVFLPWGDPSQYGLAPGGGLGDTSGWSLTDVQASGDHDGWSGSSGSLLFTQGDSEAVTPAMCITALDPTLRFFAVDPNPAPGACVVVSAIFEGVDGKQHSLTLARVQPGTSWAPSLTIPIAVDALAPAYANGWTPVAFDFRAQGLGKDDALEIDGIYVDPAMRI